MTRVTSSGWRREQGIVLRTCVAIQAARFRFSRSFTMAASMPTDFDVIVIGSGFGGAICGARLAEAGYRVLILERGRRWEVKDFPRSAADAWTWDHEHPEAKNGWFDFRVFPHMTVAQGAGVGGGSLVYANVSVEAKPDTFDHGWPTQITYNVLAPH